MWLKAEPSPTSTTDEAPENLEDADYETVRERFYAEGWDRGPKGRRRAAERERGAVPRDWYKEEIPDRDEPPQVEQPPVEQPAASRKPAPAEARADDAPQKPVAEKSAPKKLATAEHAIVPPPTFRPKVMEQRRTTRRPQPKAPEPREAPRPQPKAPEAREPQRPQSQPQDPEVREAQRPEPQPQTHEKREEPRVQPKAPEVREEPRVQSTVPEAPRPQPQERTPPQFERQESKAAAQEHHEVLAPDQDMTRGNTVSEDAQKESAAKGVAAESEPLIRIEMPADHVALLTLNTPKVRNALTAEMRMALRGALKALAAEDRIHALIITGADGNFCAGGDVRTMGEPDPHKIRQRMTEVAETAEAVASFPKPVIAAVAGHAAGAGVSLACLADIIVVDESTQYTFSFLRLALGPDWGLSWSLPRRVGATKARGLILSRGVIDAREAQQIGLADHFASEGETRFAAIELAKRLCNGPREATAAVKRMLSDLDGLRAALNAEMQMQLERFPSWEHQEGAKAFKEKRPADYGRKPE